MKYFGIIKKKEIDAFTIEDIEDLLVDKKIYYCTFNQETIQKTVQSNFELSFDETETQLTAVPELINEFNEFIFRTYQEYVNISKYKYFSEFNEDCYGLEFSELRKNSLSDFNQIFDDLKINQITFVDERISANGISHTHTTGKLFKLYHFQQEFKKLISTTENLINYLIGDLSFYNKEFYEKNIGIQYGIQLETTKQILVQINDKYGFEDDIYYSKKVSDAFKFKDYGYIFKTLKAYQFTNRIVTNFKTIKRTYIESLYQVLLEFNLIEDHKENFIAFIKEEYRFILPKITTFAPKENIQNDKRVILLTEEWKNNDVQKTDLDMFMNF